MFLLPEFAKPQSHLLHCMGVELVFRHKGRIRSYLITYLFNYGLLTLSVAQTIQCRVMERF
jgi:hypothetical protein